MFHNILMLEDRKSSTPVHTCLFWWKEMSSTISSDFCFSVCEKNGFGFWQGSTDTNIKKQELHLWPCRLQLCVGFGVWCRPGCPSEFPAGDDGGISWKTVWQWLNKQWKQQREGKQKTAWPRHCFFELQSRFLKVIKKVGSRNKKRLKGILKDYDERCAAWQWLDGTKKNVLNNKWFT